MSNKNWNINKILQSSWTVCQKWIPNMMHLYNSTSPSSMEEWRNIVENNVDVNTLVDNIEDMTSFDTSTVNDFVTQMLVDNTYKGGQMQDKAKEIITSSGYEVIIPDEEQDHEGIDLIAKKDDKQVNIQVKPFSFFTCKSDLCKNRQQHLAKKCKSHNIKLLLYDKDKKFIKNIKSNKYLHNC